jgi:hypothetical protein
MIKGLCQLGNIDKWQHYKLQLQWAPLNGITDNGINRLMGSNLSHLTVPKLTFLA